MRGSAMALAMPWSRASFEGQVIQPKTTVSPGSHFTASGNEVTSPSGTSSPQQSTTWSAPYSLKTAAKPSACARKASRLSSGTAAAKAST